MSEGLKSLEESLDDYDFISWLRAIDCANPDKPRQGQAVKPSEEIVRLSQKVTASFQGRSLDSVAKRSGFHSYRLFCNIFGLFGSNGPLPLHYTEYADQRLRHHQDPTFSAFVDLFNHRMLSLFYRASVEFHPAINLDRAESDNIELIVASLGGFAPAAARQRDDLPDYIRYFHAGVFGSKNKTPDGIVSLVENYFSINASVDEFTGGWLPLPGDVQTILGKRVPLGISTYLGKRAWTIGHRFTLRLGPLSWSQYLRFRPGGYRARELFQLMRCYLGDEWDWDVCFEIVGTDIRQCKFDYQAALGFNTFLGKSDNLTHQSSREVRFNRRKLNGCGVSLPI